MQATDPTPDPDPPPPAATDRDASPPRSPALAWRLGALGAAVGGLSLLVWPLVTLQSQAPARPPAIPPTVTLGEEGTPAPAPSASASPVPLPVGPRPAPPVIPPPTVLGEPEPTAAATPPPLLDGQPLVTGPPGLMPSIPAPVVLPTPAASPGERTGNGLGPVISVANGASQGSRSGLPARNWIDQTQAEADAKSANCMECHKGVEPMHKSAAVVLGCTDCHGGNAERGLSQQQAHVLPRNPQFWNTSANPENAPTLLGQESPEFIRFVNPGDLRVADQACGLCHQKSLEHVANSMMTHGALLWGAALYNNGAYFEKNPRFGQAQTSPTGAPVRLTNPFPVTPELTRARGVLPFLDVLPRFNLSQPGNTLRIFEKGQEKPLQLGDPEPQERPGLPARRLSARGYGSGLRTDPVVLGLQKTRLNDPLLSTMGSNDHPGDFRQSGCSACHVTYANDRSPTNSGFWSQYGHQGLSFTKDPTIPKNERGHPIAHQFTRSIPSSQCMSCHMHQGNMFVNPYLGYTWWDQESDGEFMYPKVQKNPTDAEMVQATLVNPEAAAARGLWGDRNFLERVSELNPQLKHTQFADYHSHGWVFRGVFKKDRHGNLLDRDDKRIAPDARDKWAKAVHLKDIHLEKGMQCGDCHFLQDTHGDGTLYGETRAATSIECMDCHGTADRRTTLVTSGNGGRINLADSVTPFGPRFTWEDVLVSKTVTDPATNQPVVKENVRRALYQYSNMDPNKRWEVKQTMDTVDPSSPNYNPKSAYAKTLHRDGKTWGDVPAAATQRRATLAHNNENITCQVCHTSWATSCFGCHLPMKANQRAPLNKYEGVTDRNFTTYNPQVVRDDVFMLGIDATTKKNRMAVLRSSSAVVVGSQNSNREWVYSQQQTVSAEGYSGQAFNPHFAHTTSGVGTTKGCTDCHLSKSGDNNAWMAQLLGFGTGTVNFFGRYVWMGAGEGGIHAVAWTEQEEPQAALGSHLHKLAYPDNFQRHFAAKGKLKLAYEHEATDLRDLTLRGEFLYTANGRGGFRVFDVANIDNKGFSERFTSSPVSPLGQNMRVPTRGVATALALPGTMANDPLRQHDPVNEEQPIPAYYGFTYGTDTVEGLVVMNVGTLVDGRPDNNFLKKTVSFNPDGLLTGATNLLAAGSNLYVTAPAGLFVVSVADPMQPRLVGRYVGDFLRNPRAVAVQFQYGFVTDEEGLKVFRLTDPLNPVPVARVPLADAGRLYLARTWAYVPNGREGLAIVDIERPEQPRLTQMFNADGELNDTRAVQVGSVNASMFALVADGKNGLKVLQLISPDTVPEHMGFAPRPAPRLIASFPIKHGGAQAISRGLDRDRVTDETGQQTVVFGRRGSRPFHLDEMRPFLRHRDGTPYRVADIVSRHDPSGDGGGAWTLLTTAGNRLSSPVPFVDPTVRPLSSGEAAASTAPATAPGTNPLLRESDAQRLLRTLDPNRTPPSLTLPPSGPPPEENPLIQEDAVERLQGIPPRDPAATPVPTLPPLPPSSPPPVPAPTPANQEEEDNPLIQPGEAERLLRSRPAPRPTPAAPPPPR